MSAVFRTEGPLSPLLKEDTSLYEERAEDDEVEVCIQRGNYVALMGARKMGKTSLLLRQQHQLLEQRHVAIYVDVSPAKDKEHEQWYGYLRGLLLRHSHPSAYGTLTKITRGSDVHLVN